MIITTTTTITTASTTIIIIVVVAMVVVIVAAFIIILGETSESLQIRKTRPGSRGRRGPVRCRLKALHPKTDFSLFYSKFRRSPGTREAKMQPAASVSKVQEKVDGIFSAKNE